MEMIDLYDHRRLPTGETWWRGVPLPAGRFRNVVHVCVFNPEGQMLIQQRQTNTNNFPGFWDVSAGGTVASGETPQQGAARELLEELGLEIDFSETAPAVTITFFEGFNDFFIARSDVSLTQLRLQPEEVQQVRWATQQDILAMMDSGRFIPYRKSFIDLLFFLRDHKGLHDR
jgi:isopentenyldiphosphate isomerase